MPYTLGQLKASTAGQAVGINPCDANFIAYCNEAQARLAVMGRWWGTWGKIRICVIDQCITWPDQVMTVEGVSLCGLPIFIRNPWWEFQETIRNPGVCCPSSGMCRANEMKDRGTVVQYADITAPARYRIYVPSIDDVGKTVIIQGNDQNNVPIRTKVGGVWIQGEQLTLAQPFVQSAFIYGPPGLLAVQKPITTNRLDVTSVDSATGQETNAATWLAYEQNPQYRRTFLQWMPKLCNNLPVPLNCSGDSTCRDCGDGCAPPVPNCTNITADALVRYAFTPALVDSDWLFLNMLAVRHGMKAMDREDKNQYDQANVEWELAKRVLRNELEAYDPPSRATVNVETFGTAHPSRIFAGFI